MPGLLVSVRSASEAQAACAGGASVIDIKEPAHGSLGMAEPAVWKEVRRRVPANVPVSVALGELSDWLDPRSVESFSPALFQGIAYHKLGLAGAATMPWQDQWEQVRRRLGAGNGWVAVVYKDWLSARAPHPDEIIAHACGRPEIAGVLVDTWDKSIHKPEWDLSFWSDRINRIRSCGRLVALAGSLDLDTIKELASLAPDLFAVRGAACLGGDRLGQIDRDRVRVLVDAMERPNAQPPEPIQPMTLLEQRTIEARIVAPLIRAFSAEVGEAKALEIVSGVIAQLARAAGAELARAVGEASLEAFAQSLDRWREGGALEIDILEQSEARLDFNVTRCRFAEMYHALGLADLGSTLSCKRDFELVGGFNPEITLTRTQTIMQGASHCDFRFQRKTAQCEQQVSES